MIDWSTTALVFPGQGSQQVGMGADLAGQYPAAQQVFDEADRFFGHEFSKLLFEGPAETLDQTINTQPALYIAGVATLRALEALYGPIRPLAVAGHSLGEFTALTAAGALSFEDGLRLVRERARLMREAGERSPGGMAALLGAEIEDARAICAQTSAETGQTIVIANDNCPGQIVLSGDNGAVDRAVTLARERGIRRAVKLAVSVAAHSPLMAYASDAFRAALDATPFADPQVPVIANVSAAPIRTGEETRAELAAQLTQTVRWRESVGVLREMGARTYLELGPKDVLTGLLKRIDRDAAGIAVNSAAAVAALGAS